MAEQLTVEEIIAKVAAHKEMRNLKSKREKNHRCNNQPLNSHSIQGNKKPNHIKNQQSLKQNLSSQSPTTKLIKKYEQLHQYYANIKRSYTSKLQIKQKYQKIQSQLHKVLKQNKKLQQNLNTIRIKSISVFNASNHNVQQSQQNYTNRHFVSNNDSENNCCGCRAKNLRNMKNSKSENNNKRFQSSCYTQHLVSRQSMPKSPKKNAKNNGCCKEHNFSDVNSADKRKSSPTKNNNMTEYSIERQDRNKFNQDPEFNQKSYENNSKHNIKRFDIAQNLQSQQYDHIISQQAIKLQKLQAEVKLLIQKLQGFFPSISQESLSKNQLIQLTRTKEQNIKKYEQLIMQQENLIKQYSHMNLSNKQQKNEQSNYTSGTIVKMKRKKSNYQQMQEKSLKRGGNIEKFGNKYYEEGASTKKKCENEVFKINSYRQHYNVNHKNPKNQRVKGQQYIVNNNKRQKYFYQNLRPSRSSSSSQINQTSEFIAVE